MPPPLESYNGLLSCTVRNIEQAQGIPQHHLTVDDILQQPDQTPIDDQANGSMSSEPTPTPPTIPLLTTNLNESTTLLRNLQTRNAILSADLARATASLAQQEAKTGLLLAEQSRRKVGWGFAAVGWVLVWLVYVAWCWVMRVEFEYIRRRRSEVFGL